MTSRRIDSFLLGLGALLILISSYQLFFSTTQSQSGLTLGTLTSTFSVVKTKGALALDWRDATIGNELTENQLIYTDNRSSASVAFKDGGSLEVGENSLIRLTTERSGPAMDLERGFIRAKIDSAHPVKVQMNGEDYILTGDDAQIQINLKNEKGEIGVLSGEVNVQSSTVAEKLDTTGSLVIDGETVTKKKISYQVSSPNIVYAAEVPTDVLFKWTPGHATKFHISDSTDFSYAETREVAASEISLSLSDGIYYYWVEGESGKSLIQKMRVVQESAVDLIRPLSGESVDIIQDASPELHLQWKDFGKLNYLVEWFDGEMHSAKTQGMSLKVPVRNSGNFRWRMKILDTNRPEAVWTNWQDIKVNLINLPTIPTELHPHDVEFQMYEKPFEKVELKWNSSHLVEYEMLDPKGTTTTNKVSAAASEFIPELAGTYKWRARALDNYLRSSAWSEWKTFVVEDLSQTKSQEGIQRIQLKKPDQAVTFTWESSQGTVSVFELAKDSQFKNIVKKVEVSKGSIQVSVPEAGAYYWRSREFRSNGTVHVSEPVRVIIEPVPAPLKPEKLPDIEVPIEELPVKTSSLDWMLNLFISSAHADELKGMAHITLPTKEDAKEYIVRIYRDENLSDLALEQRISKKEFTWSEVTPGIYYWQYAVIDYWDRESQFSDPAVLTIKGELYALPVKPKLLSPIRAVEVENTEVELRWSISPTNNHYIVEVSDDESFQNIIVKEEVSLADLNLKSRKLSPKLYYWRVTALNKKNKRVLSNTGRFKVKPVLERIVIVDQFAYKKDWKNRLMLFWAPSMDKYTFTQNGQEGDIDGNALNGLGVSGTYFFNRGALNGELLRQSGEVFEKEEYFFQRAMVDYVYTWNKNENHRWGVGVVVAQTSGQNYQINSGVVSSESNSSLSYGGIFRNYLSFNETWEMQGKALYMAGDLSQWEIGADALYHQKNYFLMSGLHYSSRSYSENSGEQTSLRLSLGIGKEF